MDKRVWIGYCASALNSYRFINLKDEKDISLKLTDFEFATNNIIEKDTRHKNSDIFELSSMVLERMYPKFYKWNTKNQMLYCFEN